MNQPVGARCSPRRLPARRRRAHEAAVERPARQPPAASREGQGEAAQAWRAEGPQGSRRELLPPEQVDELVDHFLQPAAGLFTRSRCRLPSCCADRTRQRAHAMNIMKSRDYQRQIGRAVAVDRLGRARARAAARKDRGCGYERIRRHRHRKRRGHDDNGLAARAPAWAALGTGGAPARAAGAREAAPAGRHH